MHVQLIGKVTNYTTISSPGSFMIALHLCATVVPPPAAASIPVTMPSFHVNPLQ